MALVFSIPGKTFLMGEYLALHGGPTLVALTQPCFQMIAQESSGKAGMLTSIHPESPAGRFVDLHRKFFGNFDIEFKEAYQSRGGFGASTAQFLAIYSLWVNREGSNLDTKKKIDLKDLLEAYKEVAWNGQGMPPSGADLVGQLMGQLTFFEKRRGLVVVKEWPFADLDFVLIHTGNKIATHEHLRALGDFDSSELEKSFWLAQEAFDQDQSHLFIQAVQNYALALQNLGFTCEPTLNLLRELRALKGVRAAKGCGALGADVVLVVFDKGEDLELHSYCDHKNLSIMASKSQLSEGLRVIEKDMV